MKVSLLFASTLAGLALFLSPVEARSATTRMHGLSESARQTAFVSFVKEFGKSYPADEFLSRYNTFSEHLATITQHNAEAAQGQHSWTMAVNEFSDLSFAEFKQQQMGYKPSSLASPPSLAEWVPSWANTTVGDPNFVDLRQQGLVTNVKNQGGCGSCWAFSAIASMESAHKKATGNLISLAEQEVVDCAPQSLGCNGCNGGQMEGAMQVRAHMRITTSLLCAGLAHAHPVPGGVLLFLAVTVLQWVINNGGVTREESYPYVAKQGSCRGGSKDASFRSHQRLPQNEDAIRGAVAHVGTVAVAIDAEASMQHYSAGIYTGSCGTQLNHGVAIIGYGYDQPSKKNLSGHTRTETFGMSFALTHCCVHRRSCVCCALCVRVLSAAASS